MRNIKHIELQLRRRIARQYQTATSEEIIGPLRLQFARIADPNRVLDDVAAEEDRREKITGHRHDEPLHLPYWAELWESAAGIGQFLTSRNFPTSTRVLDLGCGMGLSGTVAAALGMSVLFADLEAPALLFARLNSLRYADRVRTRQLNWQTDRLPEKFDLILGADILYEKKQWDFLEPFWRAHVATHGQILLGEPGRQTGELFYHWIREKDWNLEEFSEKLPGRQKAIRILQLKVRN